MTSWGEVVVVVGESCQLFRIKAVINASLVCFFITRKLMSMTRIKFVHKIKLILSMKRDLDFFNTTLVSMKQSHVFKATLF